MKVLIVGSGGREHAIAWKISKSPKVKKIFAAPGNGGMADIAGCVPIAVEDITSLADFAKKEKIGFTVVGPELPLTLGIIDVFRSRGLRIFGPDKSGARLEGSKVWSKKFMTKYNIPTAGFQAFTDKKEAVQFCESHEYPLVIKADGLAAGKGVVVCDNQKEAQGALTDFMERNTLGSAGETVVIEKFLQGEEISIIAITDGETILPLSSAQDHKRIYANDRGPNTGGMGAYSPVPFLDRKLEDKIEKQILLPTLRGLKEEKIDYRGVIYFGLMINDSKPYVLEYNCRFGDPETQAILPRLETDLFDLLDAVEKKELSSFLAKNAVSWTDQKSICVVIASEGYPGSYEKGKEIFGLGSVCQEGTHVFHAATIKKNNRYWTNGGRVLGITALGDSFRDAYEKAYVVVRKVNFEKMYYRRDIGWRALQ